MRARISRFVARRTLAAVTLAFLSIALALGWEVFALREALQRVDRTDQVIGDERELLKLNIDMETGIRGFLLTEDETFLQPYKDAVALMAVRFDALNRLIADNPAQENRLTSIRDMYTDWLRVSNPGISGSRRPHEFFVTNSDPHVQLLRKDGMDRIRAAHLAFATVEDELRRQRLDKAHNVKALVDALLLLVSFLGVSALLLAFKQPVTLAGQQDAVSGAFWDADRGTKNKPATHGATAKLMWTTWLRPGAFSIGLPLIAMALSLLINPYNPYPFALFFAAVSTVTWVDGMWWGFLALAISLVSADYFLLAPSGDFALGLRGSIGLVLVGFVQLFISWLIGNQKQAASALRDQASLLDLSHDCIIVRDLEGRIQFWNHGAEETYGFSRDEADGRVSHVLLQTVFPRPLAGIEAELLRNGRWEGELQHIAKDGSRMVVDSRWVLQDARKGTASTVLETNSDITVRSIQDKALRKSEAFLEQTGRLAGFGGWDVDIATKSVIWASETYRILGADPSYLPTLQQGLDLYTQEFRPIISAAMEKASIDGEGWDLEASMTGIDGRQIWARVVGTVEFEDGKPVRLAGALQDITARVAERQALQDANTRTALATESCGIGIWDWDIPSGKFTCDSLIYGIFGLKPECGERLDLSFWAGRVHVDDRAAIEQALQESIQGIRPYDADFRTVWNDGSTHHIKATGKVIRDKNGVALRMVGTNMDITARKVEEAERYRVGAKLRAVVDHAVDGLITIDVRGNVESFNPACERIFRYESSEVVGKNIKILMPEPYHGEHDGYLSHYAATGDARIIGTAGREVSGKRKDGSVFPMDLSVSVFELEDGRHYSGIVRDITARKLEEAERSKVSSKLRAVVDHAVDGLITIDARGNVESFNPACERIFGYEKSDVLGNNIKMLMPEPYHGEHDGYFSHYAATGDARIIGTAGREVIGKRKDGSVFAMDISVSAFELEDGQHYSGIVRDINARKVEEAERERITGELVRYTLALEGSNQELDAFAYAASHDLKAPLRVIHNASTWIEEDLAGHLTAETQENMNLLRSRVRRMDKLLDDLLEYSRIGRETDMSLTEAISGTALMENIQGLLSPPPGFIVDASSSFAGIEVNRMPLQQVLINLVSNAIKHHDKRAGRIEVSVQDAGPMFRFSVKDDGPGIPAEYHEQIFKMFQTLKPRDQVEGSGMGLAMVRKHIDVAGGKLKLESAVGQGSTFSFTWPKQSVNVKNTKQRFSRIGVTS